MLDWEQPESLIYNRRKAVLPFQVHSENNSNIKEDNGAPDSDYVNE